MKQWLTIAGMALGLFCVTVLGTLALQGRLDHRGTRGIPVLQHLFAAEAEVAELPRPVFRPDPELPELIPAAPAGETAAMAPKSQLFDFSTLQAGLDAEDFDRILRSARAREQAARDREATVSQRERELLARQRDLEDREEAIVERMLEVERERERLEARINQFERDVLLVHRDDLRSLREYAQTLVALDVERAAKVIAQEWADQGGRKRVTRALALVDPIDVAAMLEHLPDEQLREVLLERLKVVREPTGR